MSNIGDQIRYARKAKGMTQEALAEVLHMSRQGVSHWEAGRTMPDAATLLRLSEILEYTFTAERVAESESVQSADVPPAETACQLVTESEPIPPQKRRKPLRAVLIIAAALLVLAGGVMWLLFPREKPAAVVSMKISDTPLYLNKDPEHHLGYSWKVTVFMHNESDVPFKPEKIVSLMYAGPRITSKAYVPHEVMRPWMDSDYFFREDAPFDWTFTLSADDAKAHTLVELILYGTDEHGNELKFSVTEPLIAEFAQE